MTHDADELDRLLAGLCDDELADADRARLADALRGDPAARRRYLEWTDLHASLALEMEDRAALVTADAVGRHAAPGSRQPWFRRPSWGTAVVLAASALAASVLAGAGLLLRHASPPPQAAPPAAVAALSEAIGVDWADPTLPSVAGAPLAAGTLDLRAGTARVRMTCGVELSLFAPIRVDLIDPKSVRVHSGRLTARVPDAGVGFRVVTPKADVVDLGTEFGIAVEDDGSTEVHVAEGVVVARSTGSTGVVPILRHEAGRVDAELSEIAPVPFDPGRFGGFGAEAVPPPAAPAIARTRLPGDARVVVLGDEAVARETSLLLLSQALREDPPGARPRLYNAGLAFPLFFTESDYERYVARFRATHAVVVFGPEIARHEDQFRVAPGAFREAVTRVVDRLTRDGIEPVIATGYPLDPARYPGGQRRLDEYNRFLRQLARDRGYRLADAEAAFREAAPRGITLLVPNGREPSFEGHQQIARAILSAFGRPEVAVPETLEPAVLPGLVREWRVRPRADGGPLTAAAVAALRPDDSWDRIALPQPIDRFSRRLPHPTNSGNARDRLRGFATNLANGRGGVVAVSSLTEAQGREAVLNTGGMVSAVWLNGVRVYDRSGVWRGDYPGVERIPVALRAGVNTLVVEARHSLFLSVTETVDWPLP